MRAMTLERWNGRGTVAVGMLTLLFAVPGAAAGGTDAELQREVEQRFSKKEAVAARIDVVVRDDEAAHAIEKVVVAPEGGATDPRLTTIRIR